MGVCGCGKSSIGRRLAQHMGCAFLEGDERHPASNRSKMAAGTPLTDDDRWPWLDIIAEEIRQAVESGESLVVACSALRRIYRDRLRAGGEISFVHLTGPPGLIRSRMAARADHFMPTGLLESQLATLEPGAEDEGIEVFSIAPPSGDVARAIIARLEL